MRCLTENAVEDVEGDKFFKNVCGYNGGANNAVEESELVEEVEYSDESLSALLAETKMILERLKSDNEGGDDNGKLDEPQPPHQLKNPPTTIPKFQSLPPLPPQPVKYPPLTLLLHLLLTTVPYCHLPTTKLLTLRVSESDCREACYNITNISYRLTRRS